MEQTLIAWHNPTWVLALMCFPSDLALLTRIAEGEGTLALPAIVRDAWNDGSADAVRRGKTAGNVLTALYALSASPWRISEPSFARAVHVAGEIAKADGNGAPTGHRKIEACYASMRVVAHLWAAFRLHWEFQIRPHEELFKSQDGVRTLLGIARGVQNWALEWQPSRTNRRFEPPPLLGEDPWLVPENIAPLRPPWRERPGWLLETDAAYHRRAR